jgi:hypothetical protein
VILVDRKRYKFNAIMNNLLSILIFSVSVFWKNLDSNSFKMRELDSTQIDSTKRIRFDFKVNTSGDWKIKYTFGIEGTLYNNTSDTLYFLTTTCDGMQYSLQFDSDKFSLAPSIACNATFDKIEKIAPKSQFHFSVNFINKTKQKMIRLGYDFYEVDRRFKLSQNERIDIHNRSFFERNIIWADRKWL